MLAEVMAKRAFCAAVVSPTSSMLPNEPVIVKIPGPLPTTDKLLLTSSEELTSNLSILALSVVNIAMLL